MPHLVFTGLGVGFLLMGVGLYALTLRKPKPMAGNPTKSQLRERADLAQEMKKMRIAAACVTCAGAALVIFSFI
jgi:hypothetical protein